MAATRYIANTDFGYRQDAIEREEGREGYIRAGEPITISDAEYAQALLDDGVIAPQNAQRTQPRTTAQKEGS